MFETTDLREGLLPDSTDVADASSEVTILLGSCSSEATASETSGAVNGGNLLGERRWSESVRSTGRPRAPMGLPPSAPPTSITLRAPTGSLALISPPGWW